VCISVRTIAAAVRCLRRAGASSRLPAQDFGRHSYTVWGALGVSEVRRTIAVTLVVVPVGRASGWEVSMRGTQGLGRGSVAAGVLRQGCAIPVNRVAARSGSPIMRTILGPDSDSLNTSACPFRGPYPRAGGLDIGGTLRRALRLLWQASTYHRAFFGSTDSRQDVAAATSGCMRGCFRRSPHRLFVRPKRRTAAERIIQFVPKVRTPTVVQALAVQ